MTARTLALLMVVTAVLTLMLRDEAEKFDFSTEDLVGLVVEPAVIDGVTTYQCQVRGRKISKRHPIDHCDGPVRQLDAAGAVVRVVPALGCTPCRASIRGTAGEMCVALPEYGSGGPLWNDFWVRDMDLLCRYPNEAAIASATSALGSTSLPADIAQLNRLKALADSATVRRQWRQLE